ncbi:cyclic AMP-dependent transcription factor ATF-6 alpha-like isoform X3 [Scleropages formosus]|uniref:cyclic AMP-dependent transcription factor ATF-6 alpha-like isoform X3 n=1 Tax=Scleropages formosus TaxID=113540 RepID=UPI000878FA71|nr:cyclic AMP-dependent transcription factor ATF-6 alpha isoform X3 [Scleropages formosus]
MPQDLMPDMEKHTTEEGMAVDGDFTEASLLHRPGEPKDAEDLLLALESVPCLTEVPSLDYDLDLLAWSSDTCGDASSTCTDTDEIKQQRRRSRVSRARLSPPVKRSIHHTPKVSIQPKPVIAFPIAQSAAPLQTKTIVIQPVQSLLAVDQVTPVTICPAKITGPAMVLAPQTRMAPLRSPPIAPALPNLTLSEGPVMIPTHSQDISPSKGGGVLSTLVQPVLSMAAHSTTADGDTVARRQQRMIKNRESASLSRKKKKEYLLALEARLKVALFENQQLKKENCSLKIQLDGLISENNVLKVTAPKRRAVCLMVVLMFGMLNAGPFRLFDSETTPDTPFGATHGSRHLLGFSTDDKDTPDSTNTGSPDRWEVPKEKALMVVKKNPLLFVSPPPCQPAVNRTKSIRLAQELRGWVHRHEVERTKKRLMTNKQKNKTTLKTPGKEAEVSQIVTVQYADTTEKTSGSELQVYYARYSYYEDFFEEIHRRGDTFYVVSFRRDHLLLPATSHNKGTRPKMSLVLPAVNVNETVIKDGEYEIMMQIDCEVMDTRILHIKSSNIPPFLRANHSDSYPSAPTASKPTGSVEVLTGSA